MHERDDFVFTCSSFFGVVWIQVRRVCGMTDVLIPFHSYHMKANIFLIDR